MKCRIGFWFFVLLIMISCSAARSPLHLWGNFNISAGYVFVEQINNLRAVNAISIIDVKKDGTEFRVNGQKIFMDTTKPDQPNYYSYGKRSGELAIPKDSLYHALKAFYAMGVNEFRQRDRYYLFPVVTGIVASERGYFYNVSLPVSQRDTIQTRQGATDYKIKLLKQIDPKW